MIPKTDLNSNNKKNRENIFTFGPKSMTKVVNKNINKPF